MTTTTFDQYVSEKTAQNTIQLNVTKYCHMLCDALKQNFIEYSLKQHERSIEMADEQSSINYHKTCIAKLNQGICDYDFIIESGRKYHKIIMVANGSRSVHCFVDRVSGGVFKSASWKSPAKGERFNLLLIKDREWLFANADWSSSYLYLR